MPDFMVAPGFGKICSVSFECSPRFGKVGPESVRGGAPASRREGARFVVGLRVRGAVGGMMEGSFEDSPQVPVEPGCGLVAEPVDRNTLRDAARPERCWGCALCHV